MLGWGSAANWAKSDLDEYRAGYPRNVDRPDFNANVQFYRNEIPLRPEGLKIDEVHEQWAGEYRFLEMCHSYIQWLFPIQEAGLNPQAQVLQKHEIAVMKADPTVIQRVKKSYDMMLDFYGFTMVDRSTGAVDRSTSFHERFENLNYSSHNYLRITRMLKFLGEMGLEEYKINWLRAFEREIYGDGRDAALPNCRNSFENYWTGTILSDDMRAAFKQRIADRPPAPKARSWWEAEGAETATTAAPAVETSASEAAVAPAESSGAAAPSVASDGAENLDGSA